MFEGNHEGDDKDFLFKHKHYKIQQIISHISKIVATNNIKTLCHQKSLTMFETKDVQVRE
jgi:hypothetical protein